MEAMLRLPIIRPSSLLPLAAIIFTIAIFVVDTITDLEIAVPVFYTAVILVSVRFCSRRGVILVGFGCVALTLISDLITPQTSASTAGIINTVISILAIGSTTYLVLKIEATEHSVYEARAQLAHIARLTTLGQLTASLAHEVNQPITATLANANASLRWISVEPPDLDQAKTTIERIVKDMNRAGTIVGRIRGLAKRAPAKKISCDINDIIREMTTLTSGEIRKHRVSLRTDLQHDLPKVNVDLVQLQQVLLNLIMNAVEAMDAVPETMRSLVIGSMHDTQSGTTITVRDTGPGLKDEDVERVFMPFYTTKSEGIGLGLTITRSIVENHDGRIWAAANAPQGAVFCFTLPSIPRIS
jgi:C4-dicarboxylate-specific signal transduction histidine kinase